MALFDGSAADMNDRGFAEIHGCTEAGHAAHPRCSADRALMRSRFFLPGAVVVTSLSGACGSGMCGNDEVTRLGSADGTLDAVLFQRACGATTGFSTQVSVVRAGERLADDGGNAFVADADHGRAPSAAWGGPPANVSWRDARTLVVRLSPFGSSLRIPSVRRGVDRLVRGNKGGLGVRNSPMNFTSRRTSACNGRGHSFRLASCR